MAQEFLASYAVDIDESGANRLQLILEKNRELAEKVSAAFDQAKASMDKFLAGVSEDGMQELTAAVSGEGGKGSSGGGSSQQATAPAEKVSPKDAVKNTLLGELLLSDGTERGYALDTLLLSTVAQGTRNSADLRNLPKRSDYGLSGSGASYEDSEDYSSFQYQAAELLRQPIADAREQMQHALDAEAEGVDPTEYVNKVIETLKGPLQQVQELYDSFNFESADTGENKGFDMSEMTAKVDSFLKDTARKKLTLSADASDIVSKVNSAVNEARSIVNNANLKLKVQTETEGAGDSVAGGLLSGLKLSSGGRFSSPTRAEIAEDGGAEYVIPVSREDRAVPLLRSLLSELSASARDSLRDMLPFSGESIRSAIGSAPDIMASLAGSSVVSQQTTNNQNVQAPVNIRVEASATDPEAVGRSIYNTAERYLIRTLKTAG